MKTSVVTGGASGIGLELVKLLIEDNYKVFIVDNNKNNLEQLKKSLNPKHFVGIKEDMSCLSSPKKIYKMLKNENIDVLINSAGFGDYGKFHKTDWKKEEKMINLHVVNTTHLTKLFLKDMVKKNDGKIVKIINKLIDDKKVGFVNCEDIITGISKIKLSKQNTYNEVFAEVEKVAFEINKVI